MCWPHVWRLIATFKRYVACTFIKVAQMLRLMLQSVGCIVAESLKASSLEKEPIDLCNNSFLNTLFQISFISQIFVYFT
jgi:hypothetical protein